MRDALGQTLEPGDIIVEVDQSSKWNQFGVITGSTTPKGRIRYINGKKEKCHGNPWGIIKINEEILNNSIKQWSGHLNGRYSGLSGIHQTRLIKLSREIKAKK